LYIYVSSLFYLFVQVADTVSIFIVSIISIELKLLYIFLYKYSAIASIGTRISLIASIVQVQMLEHLQLQLQLEVKNVNF